MDQNQLMMFLAWTYLAFGFRNQKTCDDGQGAFEMIYRVHANVTAQLAIMIYMNTKYSQTYTGMEATKIFMNNIFDSINRTLEPYNVQILADYSKIMYEELPINLTPDKICQTPNAVEVINTGAKINLSFPKTPGIGNRIILYNCLVSPFPQMSHVAGKIGNCGNLGVVHIIEAADSMKIISDIIEGALTNYSNRSHISNSPSYVRNLCKYVRSCAVNNDLVGKVMKGLVNLKNNHRARIYEIEGSRK